MYWAASTAALASMLTTTRTTLLMPSKESEAASKGRLAVTMEE